MAEASPAQSRRARRGRLGHVPEAEGAAERAVWPGVEGGRYRPLSPAEEAGRHEVYELVFDAGGALTSSPHKRGAREHLTVISGRLSVTSGQARQSVGAGDIARYAADVAHRIAAEDGPARAFLVVADG